MVQVLKIDQSKKDRAKLVEHYDHMQDLLDAYIVNGGENGLELGMLFDNYKVWRAPTIEELRVKSLAARNMLFQGLAGGSDAEGMPNYYAAGISPEAHQKAFQINTIVRKHIHDAMALEGKTYRSKDMRRAIDTLEELVTLREPQPLPENAGPLARTLNRLHMPHAAIAVADMTRELRESELTIFDKHGNFGAPIQGYVKMVKNVLLPAIAAVAVELPYIRQPSHSQPAQHAFELVTAGLILAVGKHTVQELRSWMYRGREERLQKAAAKLFYS